MPTLSSLCVYTKNTHARAFMKRSCTFVFIKTKDDVTTLCYPAISSSCVIKRLLTSLIERSWGGGLQMRIGTEWLKKIELNIQNRGGKTDEGWKNKTFAKWPPTLYSVFSPIRKVFLFEKNERWGKKRKRENFPFSRFSVFFFSYNAFAFGK